MGVWLSVLPSVRVFVQSDSAGSYRADIGFTTVTWGYINRCDNTGVTLAAAHLRDAEVRDEAAVHLSLPHLDTEDGDWHDRICYDTCQR